MLSVLNCKAVDQGRLFVDRITAAFEVDRLGLYHRRRGASYHVNL
jgi:hypothetical protein